MILVEWSTARATKLQAYVFRSDSLSLDSNYSNLYKFSNGFFLYFKLAQKLVLTNFVRLEPDTAEDEFFYKP